MCIRDRDNAGAGSAAGVSVPDPSAGAKRVCGPAIRSTPVSYTHLDVYKRQSLLYTSGAIAEPGSVDKGTTRTDTTVSYTHLDVYKRQQIQ